MNIQSPPDFRAPPQVAFHRTELSVILSLYGRMVAAGEWRDYGLPDREAPQVAFETGTICCDWHGWADPQARK